MVIIPKGETLWLTNDEKSKRFDMFKSVGGIIVLDPTNKDVKGLIKTLEDIRKQTLKEFTATNDKLSAKKKKTVVVVPVYTSNFNAEEEETGMIEVKIKRARTEKTPIARFKLVDNKNKELPYDTYIGNGSNIKAKVFANGYSIAGDNNTQKIGTSCIVLEAMVWNLQENTSGFDEEENEAEEFTEEVIQKKPSSTSSTSSTDF